MSEKTFEDEEEKKTFISCQDIVGKISYETWQGAVGYRQQIWGLWQKV